MNDAPIKLINVSKKYRINPGGLKDALNLVGRRINPKNWKKDFSKIIDEEREIWALKDISFEVKKGSVLGIIGPNGAGKSTILKVLSGITKPTLGKMEVNGRVGALIEVGAGFHNELTGRENVHMNGLILGMKKRDIDKRFDEIVAFAELEKFIDTPLKKYSSGMRVRLGFSVAIHLEPEVLLVDEVLAVGDIGFQGKSIKKMLSFKEKDIAIIFISHSMSAITTMCDSVLYLKNGMIKEIGDTQSVIESYIRDFENKGNEGTSSTGIRGDGFEIRKVVALNEKGEETDRFGYLEKMRVEIHYWFEKPTNPYLSIAIAGPSGPVSLMSMLGDGRVDSELVGNGVIECEIDALPLLPGKYEIILHGRRAEGMGMLFRSKSMAQFEVEDSLAAYGYKGEHAIEVARLHGYGSTVLSHKWVKKNI